MGQALVVFMGKLVTYTKVCSSAHSWRRFEMIELVKEFNSSQDTNLNTVWLSRGAAPKFGKIKKNEAQIQQ